MIPRDAWDEVHPKVHPGDTMLTDTEIRRAIKNATTETILDDTSEGRGTGALKLRIRPAKDGATASWVAAWNNTSTSRSIHGIRGLHDPPPCCPWAIRSDPPDPNRKPANRRAFFGYTDLVVERWG